MATQLQSPDAGMGRRDGVFVALDDFYESVTFLEAPAPGQPVAEVRNVRPLDLTARALSEPRHS
jgi:hypothetical protein